VTTVPGQTRKESRDHLISILDELLREILNRMAPGVYGILNLLTQNKLQLSLANAVIERPKETYEIIAAAYSKTTLHLLDKIFMKMLRQEGMYVAQAPLSRLERGDNTILVSVVKKLAHERRIK